MYDYVIIGAGSAGCVLATRLSEDTDTSVLVLEAGPPDDDPGLAIPAATPTLWQGPLVWQDVTVGQRHAGGRSVFWPHGRTLGGSSTINGMVYVRGNALDYDTWRDDFGCAGWGYADLLPYFERAEHQLSVEQVRHQDALWNLWIDAAGRTGLPHNTDFNGPIQDGVGIARVTRRNGRRWSTADAYLRPALSRPNLTVITGAQVSKVLIESGRAVGVRYLQAGSEFNARADREVLLCGGAVNTPLLLMMSGIGPADHLRAHHIDPVIDLRRVGVGLQDHPMAFACWRAPHVTNYWEEQADPVSQAQWERDGSGPMSIITNEGCGFDRTSTGLPAPNLQYGIGAGPPPLPEFLPPTVRLATMAVVNVDVHSRGRVSLDGSGSTVRAAIDPNYLADDIDLTTIVDGLRKAREIMATQPIAAVLTDEVAPGEHVESDAALRQWIRDSVTTIFHPTSSCAMGDFDAVCDPELRVRGVSGLRVVDASVMPKVTRGNTNAPTIAVAERAADLIRGNPPLASASANSDSIK